jgi:hypothetical protein
MDETYNRTQELPHSRSESSKCKGYSQFLRDKNYFPFAAFTRKRMRSSRAMWQKCQVNRCSYRKSRFVTSITASANDSNTGSKFISACWPIVNSTLQINKPTFVRKTSKSTLNLEVYPVLVNRRNGYNGERRLKRSGQTEVKRKYQNRTYSYRRRDKLAFKVRRQNFKWKCCPSAPHNTTSFIMDYHKDEMPNNEPELSDFMSRDVLPLYFDSSYDSYSCGEEKSSDSDNDDTPRLSRDRSRTWEDYLLQDELVPVITR